MPDQADWCGPAPENGIVAGTDEVGRGPLAGDVVAAAVILDPSRAIAGLADSKKLTERQRNALFDEIVSQSVCYAIGRASVDEIDSLNILQASLLAMHRAVDGLATRPEFVYVDGNRCPAWHYPSQAVINGDARVPVISAASIIAKVTRDREMQTLAQKFPGYGFDRHKGYPTAAHLSALQARGPCEVHRKSFGPVAALLQGSD